MALLNQSIPVELRKNPYAKVKFPYYYITEVKGKLAVKKDIYRNRKVDVARAKQTNLFVDKNWANKALQRVIITLWNNKI